MFSSPDIEILRLFRGAAREEFIPCSQFAEPDRAAERIRGLQAAGYGIEHHPHRGYRLVSAPDRLIADDILSQLAAVRWLRRVVVFESTGSTNDVIAGMARDGAPSGIVAFAEEQSAGRGRLGRHWQSQPRLGLWFSLLMRPEMPFDQWPRLTLHMAFAVARGIGQYPHGRMPPIDLKWPNDLFVSGRKLAGILVESSLGENAYAVAGVGINVNHENFPAPLERTATSLRIEAGAALDRNALAASILASIDQAFSVECDDFPQVLAWAAGADCLRGRWISSTMGGVQQEGEALGLDPEGALLIRSAAGTVTRLSSGEVTAFSSGTA